MADTGTFIPVWRGVDAARQLSTGSYFVETSPGTAANQIDAPHFLKNLPAPDFNLVSDPKARWAVAAKAAEGSAAGSAAAAGTAYVVSAEVFKRLKAHRF